MTARVAKKSTKKPAKKAGTKTKKAAAKKTIRTSAQKPAKTVSKPAPLKTAKTAKPAKKAPLKKPVAAKKSTAVVKKTGAEKKTSDAKRKPAKVSVVKKPVKTARKPAGAKIPTPSMKSSQGKAGKIPAPAAAKTKATAKKLKKIAPEERAARKTTAKVPSAPAKKTGLREKAPVPGKAAAAGKTVKTTKKPSAVGVEKKQAKAGAPARKAAEKEQKKIPTKTAAQEIIPAKPEVKAVRKTAAVQPTGEKQKKPAAQREPVSEKTGAKPVEEQKAPVPEVPLQRRTRLPVSKAGMKKESAVAKTPVLKKETDVQGASPGKRAVAAKKTGKKEPAVSLTAAPERPKLKIFLPGKETEEEYLRESVGAGLPEEYGENALIALAVDPNTIFVDWEIVPAEIAGKEGELTLRFHDTTGIEFDGGNANAITDIRIARRVGNGFFVISMPGRDVIVEAGIMGPGSGFHAVVRSDVVSFPFLLSFDDLGIVQKLLAAGIPVGY